MLDEKYIEFNITTELWWKHVDYVSYYYWLSFLDGELCTVTKYKKLLYDGEITLFKEKIDKRKKFILEKELEGYQKIEGKKKEDFEVDAFSPINNIMYEKNPKRRRNSFLIKIK